jgi:hypothetical protein
MRRWTVCLITILLSGCENVSLLERATESSPIMPLWERYQQCLVSTNPDELVSVIESFGPPNTTRIEPPSWMMGLGRHVVSQPIRTAFDPQALRAACTLRVAALLVERARISEALVLYQGILARYSNSDVLHYVHQAKEALKKLSGSVPAVVAFHTQQASSR